MESVSTAWKSNQSKRIVNESFVEVSLDIADPDAIADATSKDNGAIYLSNTSQVVSEVDKNIPPYATLEQNLWVLNGSRKFFPASNMGDIGFIGDTFSDANCGFSEKMPIITVNFTRVHHNPIPAITITWGDAYGEYAEDFVITVYNGENIVVKQEVLGNKSVKSVVMMDIVDYDRITIAIHKWCLPNRRARVADIFVGLNKVYSKNELFSYSHDQNADPISTSLPKAEVSFSVDNTDRTYDPFNNKGLSKYLMERQEIKTRYGYKLDNKIEWVRGGTFYLSEWGNSSTDLQAEFKARDLLEFMSETVYEGLYNERGTSLYDLATMLFEKANLPLNNDGSVKWIIDDSLKDIYTTAPLPIDTIANCLQMIANAGECVFYQDRKGILHIEPFNSSATDYSITPGNSYSKPSITFSKPLKQVNVSVYHYFDEGILTELYKGTLRLSGVNEVWVTYSGMAKTATATVTGGTLVSVEYYTNACKLTIAAEGEVSIVVEGTTLKSSKTDVVTPSSVSGEIISLDNPLITNQERAVAIGSWVAKYLINRLGASSSWRADPRLDALDVVNIQTEYDDYKTVITDVSYTYNGAFKGTLEGKVT